MISQRKFILRGRTWAWRLVILTVVFFNFRLYCPSPLTEDVTAVPAEIVAQLAANRTALDSGTPSEMQELFPEGFYFSHLFHGLTWVELALREESFCRQATDEALDCLEKLNSAQGRQPFPAHLPPDHGAFYSSWKCSLRAGIVLLQQGTDAKQLETLRLECDRISDTIRSSATPFPASYDGAAWPCDTVPGIHAMSVYDRITQEGRYREAISAWLQRTHDRLDAETGLIPHSASLPDGRQVGFARATSQGIILRLLPDIDPKFAKEQYAIYCDRFLTSFAGAPCVLEYPSGVSGFGDIDSGPLIFGRSLSGTVMAIAVTQVYGDHTVANAIAQAGETVGLPWTSGGQKRYAAGLMPIGDIIVAYAHVARPWFEGRDHYPNTQHTVTTFWRWPIHAWSLIVFLPQMISLISKRISARQDDDLSASITQ